MSEAKYLDPESTQTLRDAINELKRLEGVNDAEMSLAPELAGDIAVHDAIHVIFGCRTGLHDELAAHVWTALGTTYQARDMARVNMHNDHREVLRRIGHSQLLRTWITQLSMVAKIAYRAHRMTERFPAHRFDQFLDQRLVDIRRKFNIRIAVSNDPSDRTGAGLRSIKIPA